MSQLSKIAEGIAERSKALMKSTAAIGVSRRTFMSKVVNGGFVAIAALVVGKKLYGQCDCQLVTESDCCQGEAACMYFSCIQPNCAELCGPVDFDTWCYQPNHCCCITTYWCCWYPGRPFVVDGNVRTAVVVERNDW